MAQPISGSQRNEEEVPAVLPNSDPRPSSHVLTLEEIGNLAAEGGKPAETLMNVVALIAKRFKTEVCSAYLLEPDRTNLILAATVGLRPSCVGTLRMALQRRAWRAWWPNRCSPSPSSRSKTILASSISARRARRPYQSFLGVPLIDGGVLQGVLVVQTIEARAFNDDEIKMLSEAAAQLAPVVSEARTLDRFVAPLQERLWSLARNLWWSWDNDSTSLFRDLDPLRWRQLNHNPIALLSEIPLATVEKRAQELVLHSRMNYAFRRKREYLDADHTWGARHAGVLRPRPVAYFSAEFGLHESLPVYSGGLGVLAGRSHQERLRLGASAGRHRLVLRAGIFPPAAGQERLAAGRIPPDGRQPNAHGTGHRNQGRAGYRAD